MMLIEEHSDIDSSILTYDEETAKEVRESRLKWFWFVIDEGDLEKVIDLEGYWRAAMFGGEKGKSRKVVLKGYDEKSIKKSLKSIGVKPRWGEINDFKPMR